MKVIVKYHIINSNTLTYGMFEENGNIIPNKRITDKIITLGGIASNVGWLNQDVHRCTNEIKEIFPKCNSVEYSLVECDYDKW